MIRAERLLRNALLTVARANAKARGLTLAQVSHKSYGDSRFLDRLVRKECTFTAEKFDGMMDYFADPAQWPKPGGEKIVERCLQDVFGQ